MENQEKNFADILISVMRSHNVISITVDSADVVQKVQEEFPDIVCIPNAYDTKSFVLVNPDNIAKIVSAKKYYGFDEFVDYVVIFIDGKIVEFRQSQLDFLMRELERAGRYDLLIKNNG
jgi:hypothetical protein